MKQGSPVIQLLFILLALVIIGGGGFYFYGKYNDLLTKKTQIESENLILENRIGVLSSESANLERYANTTYKALPDTNAALFVANNLNSILTQPRDGVVIVDGIRISSSYGNSQELQYGEVGFEVQGTVGDVFDYLSELFKSLPLIRLSSVETQVDTSDLALTSARFQVYSRGLPAEVPGVTTALPIIEENERQLLEELETYYFYNLASSSDVSNDEGTQTNFGRENPYSSIQ